MNTLHAPHGAPRLPVAQVADAARAQHCLAEGFRRLRIVYERRCHDALPGVSHQYISKVFAGEAPCSLMRFIQFLEPLTFAERAFVLGAWLDDAPPSDKPAHVEIAEATEASGQAIGLALRVLAAPTVSPREQEQVRLAVLQAQRELEDVAASVAGGGL
jgi:hypothetical protein